MTISGPLTLVVFHSWFPFLMARVLRSGAVCSPALMLLRGAPVAFVIMGRCAALLSFVMAVWLLRLSLFVLSVPFWFSSPCLPLGRLFFCPLPPAGGRGPRQSGGAAPAPPKKVGALPPHPRRKRGAANAAPPSIYCYTLSHTQSGTKGLSL